jgi:hypothetical protein
MIGFFYLLLKSTVTHTGSTASIAYSTTLIASTTLVFLFAVTASDILFIVGLFL